MALDQFVAMLFCQLGQGQSLRSSHEGRKVTEGRFVHRGLPPGPSTLAYANPYRPWEIHRDWRPSLVTDLHARLPVSANAPLSLPAWLLVWKAQ
jgi:hypothetical protein